MIPSDRNLNLAVAAQTWRRSRSDFRLPTSERSVRGPRFLLLMAVLGSTLLSQNAKAQGEGAKPWIADQFAAGAAAGGKIWGTSMLLSPPDGVEDELVMTTLNGDLVVCNLQMSGNDVVLGSVLHWGVYDGALGANNSILIHEDAVTGNIAVFVASSMGVRKFVRQ